MTKANDIKVTISTDFKGIDITVSYSDPHSLPTTYAPHPAYFSNYVLSSPLSKPQTSPQSLYYNQDAHLTHSDKFDRPSDRKSVV